MKLFHPLKNVKHGVRFLSIKQLIKMKCNYKYAMEYMFVFQYVFL